ncbi:MAG: hypothetical protein L3J82_10045 [Planctomycetes bacterium]|nr:hypothetical protein [Planctomycetota bacterium]
MPLYGHELNDTVNPLEAGLRWAVKLKKDDFIGKQATVDLKNEGVKQSLVGLNIAGKRIPRQGQGVIRDGKTIGKITSGTRSPWTDDIIAMAYVPSNMTSVGTAFDVEFTSKASRKLDPKVAIQKAIVVPLPFYKREGK